MPTDISVVNDGNKSDEEIVTSDALVCGSSSSPSHHLLNLPCLSSIIALDIPWDESTVAATIAFLTYSCIELDRVGNAEWLIANESLKVTNWRKSFSILTREMIRTYHYSKWYLSKFLGVKLHSKKFREMYNKIYYNRNTLLTKKLRTDLADYFLDNDDKYGFDVQDLLWVLSKGNSLVALFRWYLSSFPK